MPANQFAVNGLVEIRLHLRRVPDLDGALVLGGPAPGTGNTIKLYDALAGADDVNGFDSLALLLGSIDAVQKSLLPTSTSSVFSSTSRMTFGSTCPTTCCSLILVSDNNFSLAAFTQFLLFAAS